MASRTNETIEPRNGSSNTENRNQRRFFTYEKIEFNMKRIKSRVVFSIFLL